MEIAALTNYIQIRLGNYEEKFMKSEQEVQNMPWQPELPSEDGLYDYQGKLHGLKSESEMDCSASCRVIVRKGDGPRVSIFSESGEQLDVHRTAESKWRGPVGPARIPIEEARRAE